MTRSALCTGGAGFVGSNLVKRLDADGWDVDVVDNLTNGHMCFVPEYLREDHLWLHDFSSPLILDRIRKGKYEVVFHLAAIPRVSYSVEYPLVSHEANVTKTLSLMDACRDNVDRFVFASSSSVYGGADILPTEESYPKSPKSPYAMQKSIIEDYLRLYWKLYKLDSASMRFFTVFGPHQTGNSPYMTALSAWMTAIKKGIPMRMDGDGSQSRDLCYVDNTVDACIRAADFRGSLQGEAFNVACGDRTTNAEIMQFLKDRFPSAKSYEAPPRVGDVAHTQASIKKTKSVLGYDPKIRFWEGFEKTIKWHDDNWDLIKDF